MSGVLGSLSGNLQSKISQKTTQAILYEVDPSGQITNPFAFQYFPETIRDSKAVDYSLKKIPGASLPIYNWTGGGERHISFKAYFTSDVNFSTDASLALKFQAAKNDRVIDVRSALTWLRRYIMPSYGSTTSSNGVNNSGVPLTQAPSILLLQMSDSGIGSYGGFAGRNLERKLKSTSWPKGQGHLGQVNSIYCIMTRCDIEIESCFHTGQPRIATVELNFAQTAQYGGTVRFPGRTSALNELVEEGQNTALPSVGATTVWPYTITLK
jgi:hypothetical protein